MQELAHLRVVDVAGGLAAGYAAKLLGDAGAQVVLIEDGPGDPLRRWSAASPDRGGALFAHLHHGHHAVAQGTDAASEALAAADVLIIDNRSPLVERPGLVTLSITPYGRFGPYADRPATEFTLQADSGGLSARGHPDGEPFQCGGQTGLWMSGLYGAVGALAACRRQQQSGVGEVVDVSIAEVCNLSMTMFADLYHQLEGRPEPTAVPWSLETPSIEPTADGYVGFNTNTRQQLEDFCALIGRPDVVEDYAYLPSRTRRWDEWNELVHAYTTEHDTAEIVALASALRIPVAPVCDGRTVLEQEHFVAREVFQSYSEGAFVGPRRPYLIDGERPGPPEPSPHEPGDHRFDGSDRPPPSNDRSLPLAGLTVLDATAWWAGPTSTQVLAALGADVIHVESVTRPDGMRMVGGRFLDQEQWWERSWFYIASNTNKRGLTLDLSTDEGKELFMALAAEVDVVVENFTPRVFDGFGIGWDDIHAANERTILVRMPAFGLDGPWRDRPGFAQTMEQVTGLAWVTGHADDQPRIQRGPCDPNAGTHAAFAVLVALARRDRTGEGCLLEAPMVEAALNIAAEQVVEYSAYGTVLEREGNRSPHAAPQNLYPTTDGSRRPVAVSVADDTQWSALCAVLGRSDWAADDSLATHHGRRGRLDELDEGIAAWTGQRSADAAAEELLAAGVPAAALADSRLTAFHPQFVDRGYCEPVEHPLLGALAVPVLPFRFAGVGGWVRSPAPMLGQHNAEVLASVGVDPDRLTRLEDDGVIGTTPRGLG
ncbi:MAG: CoA transferase [Acidimicrobiales bacterium]